MLCSKHTSLLKSGNKDMTNFRQSKDANGDAIQKWSQLRVAQKDCQRQKFSVNRG